jgi:hypothetical protein
LFLSVLMPGTRTLAPRREHHPQSGNSVKRKILVMAEPALAPSGHKSSQIGFGGFGLAFYQ